MALTVAFAVEQEGYKQRNKKHRKHKLVKNDKRRGKNAPPKVQPFKSICTPSMTKQYDFEGKSKNKNDCKAKSKVLA